MSLCDVIKVRNLSGKLYEWVPRLVSFFVMELSVRICQNLSLKSMLGENFFTENLVAI